MLETIYVLALFAGCVTLWKLKQHRQSRETGRDPEVMARSADRLQQYLFGVMRGLTGLVVLIVVVHGSGVRGLPGFERVAALDGRWADHAGLALGALGLVLCAAAQATMGSSWRVGIDEERPQALVMSGVFGHIRNPTYLGLGLVNAGVWLIWPTCAVAMYVLFLYFFLEVQVRCEETHLLEAHGEEYRSYLESSKRYLPGIY